MAYSDEHKKEFLKILVSKDFDIKNTTVEFNEKYNSSETKLQRSTVYDWIKNDELFKSEFDTLRNELLDESEKMHQLLRRGIPIFDEFNKELIAWQEKPDRQAIEFFLKNKGKDRGYSEHSSIDLTTLGKEINTQMTVKFVDGSKKDKDN